MRAHTTKVQPLTLDNLLEMRKQLAQRLNAMRAEDVTQTEPLERLYERCDAAIHHAQVDQRISSMRSGEK